MKIEVEEVRSRRELLRFIKFPERLYKDNPNWVPPLHSDELFTLGPGNPALDFCERACYLAVADGEIVGRVAAIVNRKSHELWGEKVVRFGWLDFIDDIEVLRALIGAVADFGRSRGCTSIKGPLGFSDLDKEGLLVEDFDVLAPFTVIYNHPYYGERLEELGFVKDADWIQKMVEIPAHDVPRLEFTHLVEESFGLHTVKGGSMKQLSKRYGVEIFHLVNEAFSELYEYTPLSDRQIESYLKTYVPILNRDFVSLVVNSEDHIAGFAFCVPSLSRAFQKARGRLFPFGFIHILKALRKNDTVEALMIGVLPKYQGLGASALMFKELLDSCRKHGIVRILANPQLENNYKVQSIFDGFEFRPFMRRRSYVRTL